MLKSPITIDAVKLPPPHPGTVIAEELEAIGVSIAALARALDVPQSRMTEIVRGRRGVTADTALRLARYFGTSPRLWVNLQSAYDLAVTEAREGDHINAVVRTRAA